MSETTHTESMRERFDKKFRKKGIHGYFYAMDHREILDFLQSEISRAVAEREEEKKEILESLLDMYGQYCSDGHIFMSAGEGASYLLEKHGLAFSRFDVKAS